MTIEFFDACLNELCERKPFHRFSVELSSGRRIEIEQPRGIAFREGFAVFYGADKKFEWFNHQEVIRFVELQSKS